MMSKPTSMAILACGQVIEVTRRRLLFMQWLEKASQTCNGQLETNQHTTVRTRVGSTYGAGEDCDIT